VNVYININNQGAEDWSNSAIISSAFCSSLVISSNRVSVITYETVYYSLAIFLYFIVTSQNLVGRLPGAYVSGNTLQPTNSLTEKAICGSVDTESNYLYIWWTRLRTYPEVCLVIVYTIAICSQHFLHGIVATSGQS
jgi:hypothetical protein